MTPLIVPVLNNYEGFFRLIASIEENILPVIIDNTETNMGVARSWNVGIEKCLLRGHRYAVIANDDCYFTRGSPSALVQSLRESGAAIISANPHHSFPGKRSSSPFIEHSPFYCFAADLKVLDDLGGFDERFYPCYFEDNDMYLRLHGRGHLVLRDGRITAPHNTVPPPNVRYPDFLKRNQAQFEEKWAAQNVRDAQ